MAEEKFKIKQAFAGLNMDSVVSQMKEGQLSYAMNATVENFDGRSVTYQNEQANTECVTIPEGYTVIGNYTVPEDDLVILFLVGPNSESEIGSFTIGQCAYNTILNADCLKFDKLHPIHDVRHKKNKCGTEIYWTDGLNPRRWLDLSNLPYKTIEVNCDTIVTDEVDCNKLNIQPNFSVPSIDFIEVTPGGTLVTGTYQFAIQYSSSRGDGYTSYYSVTTPISIFQDRVTQDFNYPTDKSITFTINNIETSGIYSHINIAVIRTINNIPEIELIGTYDITGETKTITYTGTEQTAIKLTINDIAERFPFYETAGGLSRIDNVLLWYNLKTSKRHILQKIANKIKLNWVTYRVPAKEGYKKAINTAELRGYMRDEVYALEVQFLLRNGKETDGFHIPGPEAQNGDWDIIHNSDATIDKENECDTVGKGLPKWKVYNTGEVLGTEPVPNDDCYTGIYQYGSFGFWQSDKLYDCNEDIWGDLAGKPIRHHRFPDNLITHHHDEENIYPIGIRLDRHTLKALIAESDLTPEEKESIVGFRILRGNRSNNKSVKAKGLFNNVGKYKKDGEWYFYPNYSFNDLREDPFLSFRSTANDSGHNPSIRLKGFAGAESRSRFAFHSPDTHFYQPTLGNHIKVESIEYGLAQAHFVPVKEHAEYKFLSTGAFSTALIIGAAAALARTQIGLSISGPDIGLGFATYNIALGLMEKLIPSRNFAYQYNGIGNYTKYKKVPNNGNKLRAMDISAYLTPGWQDIGDVYDINNYQRESSVYVKTDNTLLFPHEYGAPIDNSRYVLSDFNLCSNTNSLVLRDISSYYGSIKQYLPDQWGDLYSYESISTGFQFDLEGADQYLDIFGGDIFINKFAFKNKFPFFIDHRVKAPDGSDVFYDELGNIAYPTYWFSTDIKTTGLDITAVISPALFALKRILGVKVNNFDCAKNPVFYQDGKIYLFSYGIPIFFVESEVNVDYRQAHNNKEGDFYPHVGEGIPDTWLQEANVSINFDNTYLYNRTFSKQIKEHFITHVPNDYTDEKCVDVFPNRVIYSDLDEDNDKKNSWLLYRPVSFKDLPYSYGYLKDIQSLESKAILARFENRSKIYNALLTMQTNGPLDTYLGNSKMFEGPSLDFADVNIGYNGTQHKLFIRTEFGHLTVDALRGKVFLVQGTSLKDIGEIGMASFFSNNLPFKLLQYFPVDIDNHFIGIGLTGTYDNVYKRLVITKQDYEPKDGNIAYLNGEFFLRGNKIELTDSRYFCNKSWTVSFSFITNSWTSFHSYIPRYYVESAGNFYTGIPGSIWEHNNSLKYNNFYDQIDPYILEYPYSFSVADEISQAVIDYTTCLHFDSVDDFYQEDGIYFNKAILYNNQQCSGVRNLIPKPKNSLKQYMSFPKYNSDSIDILLSKVDNKYQYNTFWNIVKDNKKPVFTKSCTILDKELNTDNLDYSPRNFNKQPLRAKELKIRHILDNTDQYKLISNFVIHESQVSYA